MDDDFKRKGLAEFSYLVERCKIREMAHMFCFFRKRNVFKEIMSILLILSRYSHL